MVTPVFPKDKHGVKLALVTNEKLVFDNDGTSLSDKLARIQSKLGLATTDGISIPSETNIADYLKTAGKGDYIVASNATVTGMPNSNPSKWYVSYTGYGLYVIEDGSNKLYFAQYKDNTLGSWTSFINSDNISNYIGASEDKTFTIGDGESIQTIIDSLPRIGNGHNVTIWIEGTHNEDLRFIGFTGYTSFHVRNKTDGTTINGCISIQGSSNISFNPGESDKPINVVYSGTSSTSAIYVIASMNVFFNDLTINASVDCAIHVNSSVGVSVFNTTLESTGAGYGTVFANFASNVLVLQSTISANSKLGIYCFGSIVNCGGVTNNASTKSVVYGGGKVISE